LIADYLVVDNLVVGKSVVDYSVVGNLLVDNSVVGNSVVGNSVVDNSVVDYLVAGNSLVDYLVERQTQLEKDSDTSFLQVIVRVDYYFATLDSMQTDRSDYDKVVADTNYSTE
jgi:hypothetical protein